MAATATASIHDVSQKDSQSHPNSTTRIDLGNIADVPYYVESNLIINALEAFFKVYCL